MPVTGRIKGAELQSSMKRLLDYIYHSQDDGQNKLCAQHKTIFKECYLPGSKAGF